MSAQRDGGPAFPLDRENALYPVTDMAGKDISSGMTLRDWFAGQVIGGLFANDNILGLIAESKTHENETNGEVASRVAYDYAEAMLAAREVRS